MVTNTILENTFRRLVLALAACALFVGRSDAQTTTGAIQGIVKDSTGAVVPSATITATNVGTGYSRSVATGSDGAYALRLLPLGVYKVEATLPGFKTFVHSGAAVEVGVNLRLDPVLEVGTISEVISAISEAPLVDTATAQIGRVVSQEEIQNLPLVNRNIYSLLALTAGVDSSVSVATFGFNAQTTIVNGSPDAGGGAVNYYLDGGSNVGGLRNSGNLSPSPDAVQEFRVVTNSFSAEYGRFGGGAVDIITKSGTNALHGSVSDYFRNERMSAQRWTRDASAVADPLDRHQFGGVLGGPLIKNKTFFFASYQGTRQEQSRYRNTATVPTAAERTGDFSASATKPRDPLTNQPFPGNVIPSSRLDPTSLNILQRIPASNLPNNRFEVARPVTADADEMQLKLDHALTSSRQLSVSYFYSQAEGNNPLQGTLPWADQISSSKQHNLNLGDSWTLGPSAVNTLRLTYVRQFGSRVNISDNTIPETSLTDFGFRFQGQGTPALPQMTVTNYFNLATSIFGPTAGSNLYGLRDTLNLSRGKHALRIGAEVQLEKMVQDTSLNNYGTFSFTGSKTGNALADFMMGTPFVMNQDAPVIKYDNTWSFGMFVQDDVRLGNRVTLNLGARYDVQLPPTDPEDRKLTFVEGQQSQVVPAAPRGLLFPGDMGPHGIIPAGIVRPDLNNVSPRLGLAWDATGDGKTAVRVGAGIFYGTVSGNEWNQTADNQPFSIRQTFDVVTSLTNPYGSLGGVSPFPYTYDPSSPRFIAPSNIYGIHPDFVLPRTYQMNVAVQRQITRDVSVNVAYVGALARGYAIAPDLNYPLPGAGSVNDRRPFLPRTLARINLLQSIGESDYHGLQTTFQKRGKNLSVNGFYSFGKALESVNLGNTVVQGSGNTSPAQNSRNLEAERARTATDRRHNFVASMIWKIDYFTNSHPILRLVANNWTLAATATVRSGTGFSVTSGLDRNADGILNDRANRVGDWRLDSGRSFDEKVNQWFNPAAFAIPAPGADGDSQRNLVDGPGLRTLDVSLSRNVRLGKIQLQIRADATNVLNTINLNPPGALLNATNTLAQISGAAAMRDVQVGAKISF